MVEITTSNSVGRAPGILFGQLSDHFACFTSINIFKNKNNHKEKLVRVYNQNETNISNFCKELEMSISKSNFNYNQFCNPNENYEKLEKLITSAKDKHMPSKLEKVKRYKHKLSPWITTAIIKSMKF